MFRNTRFYGEFLVTKSIHKCFHTKWTVPPPDLPITGVILFRSEWFVFLRMFHHLGHGPMLRPDPITWRFAVVHCTQHSRNSYSQRCKHHGAQHITQEASVVWRVRTSRIKYSLVCSKIESNANALCCVHFGVFRLNVENPNKIEDTRKLDSTACTAPLISIDSMFVAILRPRNTLNFVLLITT